MNDDFSNTDYFHNTFGGENLIKKNSTFNKNIPHTIKEKMSEPNTPNNVLLLIVLPILLGGFISCGIAVEHAEEKTNTTLEHIQKERFTINKFTVDSPSTTVERSQICNRLVAQIVDPTHPLNKLPGNDYKDIPQTYQKVSGYLNDENTPRTIYVNREKPFDAKDSMYIENYSATHSAEGNEQTNCEINAE